MIQWTHLLAAVILREFGYRKGSGGSGQYCGGDGVIRDLEFLEPIQISLLTERRSRAPYGLKGGSPASMGINTWIKLPPPTGDASQTPGKARKINLGGKASVYMSAGDRLVLQTPGGGGWGKIENRKLSQSNGVHKSSGWEPRGSLAEKASAEAAFGA